MRSFVKSGRIIFRDNTIISGQNAIFLDNVRKKRKLMYLAGRLISDDPTSSGTSGNFQAPGFQRTVYKTNISWSVDAQNDGDYLLCSGNFIMLYAALVVKTIMNTVSSILEYVRLTFLMENSSGLTVKSSKIFYYNIDTFNCDTVETTKIVNSKICLIVKIKIYTQRIQTKFNQLWELCNDYKNNICAPKYLMRIFHLWQQHKKKMKIHNITKSAMLSWMFCCKTTQQ